MAVPSTSSASRPNVVIYLTDDQNQWDYGAYGNPEIETPAVDALAASGIKFNFAFTTFAVCAPARASLLTGLYPMRSGAPIAAPGRPCVAAAARSCARRGAQAASQTTTLFIMTCQPCRQCWARSGTARI